mmetsp:Transcript_10097/g.21075  ORF Transcript_10097/g.21075 Transcript_10097/m.21075 type:complete len:241 (+) Transcript_10097:4511-5233(+)
MESLACKSSLAPPLLMLVLSLSSSLSLSLCFLFPDCSNWRLPAVSPGFSTWTSRWRPVLSLHCRSLLSVGCLTSFARFAASRFIFFAEERGATAAVRVEVCSAQASPKDGGTPGAFRGYDDVGFFLSVSFLDFASEFFLSIASSAVSSRVLIESCAAATARLRFKVTLAAIWFCCILAFFFASGFSSFSSLTPNSEAILSGTISYSIVNTPSFDATSHKIVLLLEFLSQSRFLLESTLIP